MDYYDSVKKFDLILESLVMESFSPESYLDIGHSIGHIVQPWVMLKGADDYNTSKKIKVKSDLTDDADEFHLKYAKGGLVNNVEAVGRIDHTLKKISVITHYTDSKERLNYIVYLLRSDFPTYEIWGFAERSKPRVINEDVASDREYRSTAKRIADKLVSMKETGFDKYVHKDQKVIAIPGEDIDSVLKGDLVLLAMDDKRPAKGVYGASGKWRGPEFDRVVVFYILSEKILNKKIWGGLVLEEGRIVHEVIHMLDSKRQKEYSTSIESDGSIKNLSNYYNSPSEFNAYYQEGVYRIEDDLEMVSKKRPDIAKEWLDTWEGFKNFALMRFDDAFREYLNEKFTKKLYRRLYQVYEDMKSRFSE